MGGRDRRRSRGAPPKAKPEFELDITGLLHGPQGVGRGPDGRAVFVPLAAPGDRVRVRVERDRKSFVEASLRGVVTPGPGRRPAPCPVFGQCGGCQWQHVAYDVQLQAKDRNVKETLRRMAKLEAAHTEPPVPSPQEYEYRHRVVLRGQVSHGKLTLGFLEEASHHVVPHDRCWLYPPAIREALAAAGARLPADVGGTFRCFGAQVGDRTSLSLEVREGDLAERLIEALTAEARERRFVFEVRCEAAPYLEPPKPGAADLAYPVHLPDGATLQLTASPRSFFQANLAVNDLLVAEVLAWAGPRDGASVLDLYCGVGNFTLPLARGARETVGVESDGDAAVMARANAEAAGVAVEVLSGSCETVLDDLVAAGRRFDLVVLDPPRTGAQALLPALERLAPKRILFVACDPATLARDAAGLVRAGWRLERLRAFDLFPQTYHVEALAELVR